MSVNLIQSVILKGALKGSLVQSLVCFVQSFLSLSKGWLHGGAGLQVGEVTRSGGVTLLSIQSLIWSPHLSCKRHQIKIRDYRTGLVTPPKRVTSPTWGPPSPCEQALSSKRRNASPFIKSFFAINHRDIPVVTIRNFTKFAIPPPSSLRTQNNVVNFPLPRGSQWG